MKIITRFLSAVLALCLLTSLCLPARAAGTQDCGAKLLAITFDDGPGKYTGALLDGLAERGVHATFFVNGVNASGWPETLKRIVNEGHQLANHTYNHKNLNTCSAQTVAYEISAVQALITAAGGDENAYIRAPYGNANKTVKSVVTAPLIYWSVDPEDWKYRNAETVRSNIESGVSPCPNRTLLDMQYPDSIVFLCILIRNNSTSVPGTIIHYDKLKFTHCLCQNRLYSMCYQFFAVMRKHYNTYFYVHLIHGAFPSSISRSK